MDDKPPNPNTLDAILGLAFRWMGRDHALRPLPADESESEEAREARGKCGARLIQLIGSMPLDTTRAAQEAEGARKDRERLLRHLVETGITEVREVSDKFGHLVDLLKRIEKAEDDFESLLAIAVETAEQWRDRTDAVREGMKDDLASFMEARP